MGQYDAPQTDAIAGPSLGPAGGLGVEPTSPVLKPRTRGLAGTSFDPPQRRARSHSPQKTDWFSLEDDDSAQSRGGSSSSGHKGGSLSDPEIFLDEVFGPAAIEQARILEEDIKILLIRKRMMRHELNMARCGVLFSHMKPKRDADGVVHFLSPKRQRELTIEHGLFHKRN